MRFHYDLYSYSSYDGNAVAVSRGVSMALGLAKAFCIVLTCSSI